MNALIVAGALALTLVACGTGGSGAGATSSATAVAPAVSTVAAAPAPDVRGLAAQQYLAAVTAYNLANEVANAANKTSPNSATWSDFVPVFRKLYAASSANQRAVLAITFPPDMAGDASAVVSALNSELATLSDFISSPNQATWEAYSAANTAGSSASSVVRYDLGLPSVPLAAP